MTLVDSPAGFARVGDHAYALVIVVTRLDGIAQVRAPIGHCTDLNNGVLDQEQAGIYRRRLTAPVATHRVMIAEPSHVGAICARQRRRTEH